jgi:hypothetical protein
MGIDPGGDTGVVLINENKEIIYTWCIDGEDDIYIKLNQILFINKPNIIIIEDYRNNIKSQSQRFALELIGFIKGLCSLKNIYYKMQMPAVRKGYIKQAKNMLPETSPAHIIDALAHALRFIDKGDN